MSELELILDPIAPAEFMRAHWDRKPLHIPGPPMKFATLYDAGTWATFEGVDDLKAVTTDAKGVQVEIAAFPPQAGALFMAGFTLCANVSHAPTLVPLLHELRRELGSAGGPAFAKLYASNDGHGFAVHADSHHVFVLQLSGKKHWRFSRTPVIATPSMGLFLGPDGQPCWTDGDNLQRPARDDGTPIPAPAPETFASIVLEPGHCLYLPPGTWHVARAIGHSLAVSVSPDRAPAIDLLVETLRTLLADKPGWRRDLEMPTGATWPAEGIPTPVAHLLDARLAALGETLAHLDRRHLHRIWMQKLASGDARGETTVPNDVEIHRSTVFTRAGTGPFRFLVAPADLDGGERCFFYCGAEWSLPLSARAFLTALAQHDEFRAEASLAWDRKLKFDEVRGILKTLVKAGVLQPR